MTEPSAKVIADSVSDGGFRLTTMEVVMHRFVLAEFNTHRAFSRNSASSRAIPVHKQIDKVLNDTAFPVEYGTNQPGMQAGPPLGYPKWNEAQELWQDAAQNAVYYAEQLRDLGIHKQVTNRLLEPYMWHRVIVSSTEWNNFFNQRCSPLAQPEIRVAAEAMYVAYSESTPDVIKDGHWHMPYLSQSDWEENVTEEELAHVSAARCARVSYLTHDGVRDIKEDLALYDKLVTAQPPHYSPLEHVATPNYKNAIWVRPAEFEEWFEPYLLPRVGNYLGWDQLRHQI